jgi:hypothetical protein
VAAIPPVGILLYFLLNGMRDQMLASRIVTPIALCLLLVAGLMLVISAVQIRRVFPAGMIAMRKSLRIGVLTPSVAALLFVVIGLVLRFMGESGYGNSFLIVCWAGFTLFIPTQFERAVAQAATVEEKYGPEGARQLYAQQFWQGQNGGQYPRLGNQPGGPYPR